MEDRDLKSTYDKIAEDWSKDHADDDWWLDGTDYFLSLLPRGASILDVGCGAGVKSKYMSDKGFKVTGVDFSGKMIEIARKEVSGVQFLVMDVNNLNSLEEKFDGIFAQAILLHIPHEKVSEILGKLKNKLNPNGFLHVAVKEVKPNGPLSEMRRENDYGYEYERFFSYFTVDSLEEYLNKSGLKLMWKNISNSRGTNWIQLVANEV